LIRGFDNTAFGVEYDRHGLKRYAYATKEVIISAGTVETAKLLMLSGIGPKTHLADLGVIPRHPDTNLLYTFESIN